MIYYIIFIKKQPLIMLNVCNRKKHLEEIGTEKSKYNLGEGIVIIDVYTKY